MLRLSRQQRNASTELVEIVTPRTNAAMITPAENLFAAISLPEAFSLEIAATHTARWFLVRASSLAMRHHLEAQLAVAYPQAHLRGLDTVSYPGLDPARVGLDEQVAACTLRLRGPQYLPIRAFRDPEVDAVHNAQADPVLGILGALHDLPEGWRGLAQLVLRPAPEDWCRDYLRLAVEHPLAPERATHGADTSLAQVFGMAGLLVAGTLGFEGYHWYVMRDWMHLTLLVGSVSVGGPSLLWFGRRLTRRPIYDMRLVQEKVSRIAHICQIRLAIFAPTQVAPADVEARLTRLAAAYRQYSLASGNGLRACPVDLRHRDLRDLTVLLSARSAPILNTRELAGLWHLPQASADVPLVERTTARQRLPLPFSVAQGCRIGASAHQGKSIPVSLPDDVLNRHLLLVAKTRRGKSSLLTRIAKHVMGARCPGKQPSALMLVDPHRDLARAALGLVPHSRLDDVVFLDASERDRPFGLNLLDVGLGWDRDKAVSNALAIFRREFGVYWGPRMEDSFRFALLTLYEANQSICQEPEGRRRQHTILDVPALFLNRGFRQGVQERVADPVIHSWWKGYFDQLDRRLMVEIVNPIQTKVQRYAGAYAARSIVGQPRSTIDPGSWLRSGSVVIVNTSKGTLGEDTSALLGASLLNLVALTVGEQAALDPSKRRSITIIVDEFHTMPGADYEGILAELAKYGANLVLATQSLSRLDALDQEQNRALRAMVFANLDGLFAFHTSAEDAEYLVRELGGEVDEQDLVALGEHQCYVKLSLAGERTPTFSVRLDPPPQSDPDLCTRLSRASAQRYGRDRSAVERDLASALARLERQEKVQDENASDPGFAKSPGKDAGNNPDAGGARARNQHRDKPPDSKAVQEQLEHSAPPSDEDDTLQAGDRGQGEWWRGEEPA
jgi:hypothetical protein